MEIKVEKGQFRWKLLVFVFFTSIMVFYPIILTFNLMTNLLINVIIMIALTIPVDICVLLQKSWPIKIKLLTILYIIFCFVISSRIFLVLLMSYIFNTVHPYLISIFLLDIFGSVILNLAPPLALAIFSYDFILRPFHKKYDTDIRYVIIPISIRKHLLLRFTYIGLFLSMIVICFCTGNITGISFPEKDYEGIYMFMEFLLPSLFYTVLFAVPAQFLVLVQKGWSLGTKITNILVVEAVFLSVCTIIVFLSYCIITISPILYSNTGSFIPFIVLAGGVLLRHIFIKSSLDALEHNE